MSWLTKIFGNLVIDAFIERLIKPLLTYFSKRSELKKKEKLANEALKKLEEAENANSVADAFNNMP